MNHVYRFVIVVCLVLSVVCTLPVSAQTASNNFHIYGYISDILVPVEGYYIYTIEEPGQGGVRAECYPTETLGCDQVSIGSWVIVDGYLNGVLSACQDGATNENHVTSILRWDSSTNTWPKVGCKIGTPGCS